MSKMDITQAVTNLQEALSKVKEVSSDRPLAKNEIQAAVTSDGAFSIEFGADISSGLRKSAVQWLYDRGFALTADRGASQTFHKKEKKKKDDKTLVKTAKKRWAIV